MSLPDRSNTRPAQIAVCLLSLALAAVSGAQPFTSQVNVDPNGDNIAGDAANESSIAVDPTAPNRMAIGWRQFDAISSNFRQAGVAWTNDGGRTWHNDGPLDPGNFRSDPVLEANADGVFYYYSLRSGFFCDMYISEDAGQNWGSPINAFGGDKAWYSIDKTNGPGRGNVYVAWSTAGNPWSPNQFVRSTDEGLSYDDLITIPLQPRWGTQSVGPDGALYIAGVGSASSGSRVIRSSNAQNEAEVPSFDLATFVPMGGATGIYGGDPNPGGLNGQLIIETDHSGGPTHGNVYLLGSTDPTGSDPLDVMFARSEDGGQTWSAPVRVNDDPAGTNAWQWFGTMSVAPNGRIDAIWNDTRDSGLGNVSRLYYSSSIDGGRTWSPNAPLSDSFNSHLGWPNQSKLGDYYDMESDLVGADLAWAATFNGEQDVFYTRIGDYDCNGNGVGDMQDLADGGADCNENGILDSCEIAAGAVADDDGDGVPDECQACAADFNGDGIVNTLDFLDFLNAFNAGDAAADFNGDGVINTLDFLAFLNAFNAGC